MASILPLHLPLDLSLESSAIWRALRDSHRSLAELKGLCMSLPNPSILIETLSLQEAKDSSAIENIITTQDALYASQAQADQEVSLAEKEVGNYVSALRIGFEAVNQSGLIRLETILAIQEAIESNRAGLRKVPGTVLRNESTGETIFEPPQDGAEVESLMDNLVRFIHSEDELDPLLRLAIVHHQFESIHPFYDGNGRTGRILNILILIRENLLPIPILYLSRYINQTKQKYYRLLQATRTETPINWEPWCLYLLRGIEVTATHELQLIRDLQAMMMDYKVRIRDQFKRFYSQDLLNTLFRYPYTKIEFIERELGVSRPTASKYLDLLAKGGFVEKRKMGRTNYYINRPLFALLARSENLT